MIVAISSVAQNVGIGTNTPNANALLHVDLGANTFKGLLITGTYNVSSTVPDLGTGSRMMFYPGKAAFRAGSVTSSQWDNVNVGFSSIALGLNTTANGNTSTAMGSATHAGGTASTSMGYITTASGDYSTTMGASTTASGLYSTAMGDGSSAGGHSSVAMGFTSIANGQSSVAMGQFTTASGLASFSMGLNATASGDQSLAIGTNLSTNGKKGSFFLGDSDPYSRGVRVVGTPDQFVGRFNGGYYLISSNAGSDVGVQLPSGANSWAVLSDVRRKENFLPVDGESFLQKILKLNLTTWNYKTQDPKTFRHYGPMAQDFFAAFGKDDLGTIGCDTLIYQQDFIGVNLIAIQALVKRTAMLNAENMELKNEVGELKLRLDKLEKLMINK